MFGQFGKCGNGSGYHFGVFILKQFDDQWDGSLNHIQKFHFVSELAWVVSTLFLTTPYHVQSYQRVSRQYLHEHSRIGP